MLRSAHNSLLGYIWRCLTRRPDYAGTNISINLLLLTLQRKLANIAGIYTPIFKVIRKVYRLDTPKGGNALEVGVTHAVYSIYVV